MAATSETMSAGHAISFSDGTDESTHSLIFPPNVPTSTREQHASATPCCSCHTCRHAASPSSPPPLPCVLPLDAPTFEPSDRAMRHFLLNQGYAVIRNAVDADELRSLRARLWEFIESATPMVQRQPSTWVDSNFPGPAHLGMLSWAGASPSVCAEPYGGHPPPALPPLPHLSTPPHPRMATV